MRTLISAFVLCTTVAMAQAPQSFKNLPDVRPLIIPITQAQSLESPIQVAGQVTFHRQVLQDAARTQWVTDLRMTNVSGKPILAFEVRLDALPDVGIGFTHLEENDYFFEPQLLEPGAAAERIIGPSPTALARLGSPRQPVAEATVLFVQFADGTASGRSAWGSSLHDRRTKSITLLRSFLNAYRQGGETALSRSIADADALQAKSPRDALQVIHHVRYTAESKGITEALAHIRDALDSAAERNALM